MYTQVFFFQVKVIIHVIILRIKVAGYFICLTEKYSPVRFVITEQHRKGKHLQQYETEKSKITPDKKKYVTHLEVRHKVQDTRRKTWPPI